MSSQHRICGIAIVVALLCGTMISQGCKSVHWSKAEFAAKDPAHENKKADVNKKKDDVYGTPARMVVIWRDAVYESDLSRPARGFGGRFYFYDSESKPVLVDGELNIYAFDESGNSKSTEADRKYVFRKDELQSHCSKTALGDSYSFWIPWDEAGGTRKSIALLPLLITADGKKLFGDQTVNVLSGKPPSSKLLDDKPNSEGGQTTAITTSWERRNSQVQQASWNEAGADSEADALAEENANIIFTQQSRRSTTIIEVPAETALRLNQATSEEVEPIRMPGSSAAPSAPGPTDQRPANPTSLIPATGESASGSSRRATSQFKSWNEFGKPSAK